MEVNCKVCGVAMEIDPLPDDYANTVGVYFSRLLHQYMDSLCCATCIDQLEQRQATEKRDQKREAMIAAAVARGDIPVDKNGKSILPHYRFSAVNKDKARQCAKAWDIAREWTPAQGCIWAWGDRGVGKSHLMYSIIHRASISDMSVAVASAVRVSEALRSFNDKGSAALRYWQSADLLGIDDLDKVHLTDHVASGLWQLFDVRHTQGRPTIITCEYAAMDLGKAWQERVGNKNLMPSIMERLRPCTIIEMRGQSLRGNITKAKVTA